MKHQRRPSESTDSDDELHLVREYKVNQIGGPPSHRGCMQGMKKVSIYVTPPDNIGDDDTQLVQPRQLRRNFSTPVEMSQPADILRTSNGIGTGRRSVSPLGRTARRFSTLVSSSAAVAVSRRLSSTIHWCLASSAHLTPSSIVRRGRALCLQYIKYQIKRSNCINRALVIKRLQSMLETECGDEAVCNIDTEVLAALRTLCAALERKRPEVFRHVARQVSAAPARVLRSEAALAELAFAIATKITKEHITWSKLAAVFCVCGALAREAAEVTDEEPSLEVLAAPAAAVADLLHEHPGEWLAQHHGWVRRLGGAAARERARPRNGCDAAAYGCVVCTALLHAATAEIGGPPEPRGCVNVGVGRKRTQKVSICVTPPDDDAGDDATQLVPRLRLRRKLSTPLEMPQPADILRASSISGGPVRRSLSPLGSTARRFSTLVSSTAASVVSRRLSATINWCLASPAHLTPSIVRRGRALCLQYIKYQIKRSNCVNKAIVVKRIQSMLETECEEEAACNIDTHVLAALRALCAALERKRPDAFRHVARQASAAATRVLRSEAALAELALAIATRITKENITWSKMAAVFCVCGALAREAAEAADEEPSLEVVSAPAAAMADLLHDRPGEWIAQHHGWEGLVERLRASERDHATDKTLRLMVMLFALLCLALLLLRCAWHSTPQEQPSHYK